MHRESLPSSSCPSTQVPNSEKSEQDSITSNNTRVICDITYCTRESSCSERVGYALCDEQTNIFSVPECIESARFEFLAEINLNITMPSNVLFNETDEFGEASSVNLCDQLSNLDIRRCRYVYSTIDGQRITLHVDLIFEREMTDLASFLDLDILKLELAQEASFFLDSSLALNTFEISDLTVFEGNDDVTEDESSSSDDDSLMIVLIGVGGGGLAVFGVLFAAVYYVGHHVGKHKHGVTKAVSSVVSSVVSPTEEEEEKVDDTPASPSNENNQQEETPVTDMKTGEQYRVRALSKHTNLEDFMNQAPSRKTKKFDDDDTGTGVKKAWV